MSLEASDTPAASSGGLRSTGRLLRISALLFVADLAARTFTYVRSEDDLFLAPRTGSVDGSKEQLYRARRRDPVGRISLEIPQSEDRKNMFVIHIGPHKTGSTSMQNSLALLEAMGILPRDGFYFLGKANKEVLDEFPLAKDFIRPLLWKGPKAWFRPDRKVYHDTIASFKNSFSSQHAKLNHSVILSSEELSEVVHMGDENFYNSLEMMIPIDQYDVRFVMVYRRYFQWLLSFYHSENIPQWYNEGDFLEKWPCRGRRGRSGRNKECGVKLVTFRDYFHEKMNLMPSFSSDRHSMPVTFGSIYNQFLRVSPQNWTMHIINTHDPLSSGDVVLDILCGMGDATSHTCDYLQGMNVTEKLLDSNKMNADATKGGDKYMIDYMLMAQDAYFRGSINSNITRGNAIFAFQEKFRRWKRGRRVQVYKEGHVVVSNWSTKSMTIPLACLSREERDVILSESEKSEAELLPTFSKSSDGIESLRGQFQQLEEDHALCNIALDVLFQQDSSWIDFLNCLMKSTIIQKCLGL